VLYSQKPQLEGNHLDRILFNGKVVTHREAFPISFGYVKNANDERLQYLIHGGTIHNITLDSKFAVYLETDSNRTHQLGILHVDKLSPFSLVAKVPDGSPDFGYGQSMIAIEEKELWETNYLRIHIPHNDDLLTTYYDIQKTSSTMYNLDNIRVVDEFQDPHVVIKSTDKKELSMMILTATHHKFNHIIEDLNALPWLLSRIAHFYRELSLPKELGKGHSKILPSHSNIEVEFYKLQEISVIDAVSGFQNEKLEPVGPNLYVSGTMDLVIADESGYPVPYGIKLVNKSDQDLCVNLFHFTNSDFSICEPPRLHE
jgi:hypothetical protein